MRFVVPVFALALSALGPAMAACSSSDSTPASTGAGGAAGAGGSDAAAGSASTCPGWPATQACKSCIETHCGALAAAALGPDWASDRFAGSPCATYTQCWCACAPTDTACAGVCYGNAGAGCLAVFNPFVGCEQTSCTAECPH